MAAWSLRSGALALLLLVLVAAALHGGRSAETPSSLPKVNFSGDVQLDHVTRKIDISTDKASYEVTLEVVNTGDKSIGSFLFAVPEPIGSRVAIFSAADENGKKLPALLVAVSNLPSEARDAAYYKISFDGRDLKTGNRKKLVVTYLATHTMSPLPAKVKQSDPQLLQHFDTVYLYSIYPVATQTTSVKLASKTVKHYTQLAPTKLSGDTVEHGPYTDVAAFAYEDARYHFESNKPLLQAAYVVKELEVSAWGSNLAVEESWTDLKHVGATLEGSFSRLDYQRMQQAPFNFAAKVLNARMPSVASGGYYRDEIGNISTSHVRVEEAGVLMQIVPRFPLFGGWKTTFYFGYNLPLARFLGIDESGAYVLNVTFASAVEEPTIDHYELRVILPEGSSDISVHTPFPVDSQSQTVRFTYLDSTGRPVVVLHKKNVVFGHNQFMQVRFSFASTAMLTKPLLLMAAFFVFFLLCMIYVRVDFSITKPAAGEVKRKAE